MLQEIVRFLKADTSFANPRPLRYNVLFDSHPSSVPYITRLQAKARRVLALQEALLMTYHRNEVCNSSHTNKIICISTPTIN